ncbi:PREDICTED: uncharacterized protein LOC103601981 [Galeopterus variegatus]|uniref:Uncharacterized protein LOC103601981 n=1 Tax=Galeopterus variegatus TaxID=482537 RepID=A0ABM0RVG5_GALVR|nr:PREDICTED: uncharacterized protein LOC103601981 [Galeopterus variegatus]
MPSMFERITKKIVKELGDKDMSPVKSLLSATKFREFDILRRKKSLSLFWEQPDIPAEFSLKDILESSPSVPDTVVTGPFSFGVTMVQKQKAGVDVKAVVQLSASRVASQFCESFLEIQTVRIPPQTLEDLQQRKLLDPEPSFLQDCWNREDDLYMVTEVAELINSTVLCGSSSKNVLGKFSLWITPGKKDGETYIYPQRTYCQVPVEQDVLISDDDKQKTFPKDFKRLQQEVSRKVEALAQLSKDFQNVVFHSILAMLGDRGALQDLMNMLELNSRGHLDGPGGVILNELFLHSDAKYVILYLLEALMAFTKAPTSPALDTAPFAPKEQSSLLVRAKSLVRELGRKDKLVPVDSLSSSPCLRPFCLVSIEVCTRPGKALALGSPGPEEARLGPLHSSPLLPPPAPCGKLRPLKPSFLRELQSHMEGESLYVVSEAAETVQDTLQSLGCPEGAGQLSFVSPGHVQGQSHMAKEKTVTVLRGSDLSYRMLHLGIKEDHWGLQSQAGAQLQVLAMLPPELQTMLLDTLQELLRDPRALRELEDNELAKGRAGMRYGAEEKQQPFASEGSQQSDWVTSRCEDAQQVPRVLHSVSTASSCPNPADQQGSQPITGCREAETRGSTAFHGDPLRSLYRHVHGFHPCFFHLAAVSPCCCCMSTSDPTAASGPLH